MGDYGTILHYPRKKLVMTQPVEVPYYGHLNRDEYSKEELLDIWRQVAKTSELDVRSGQRVESITGREGAFLLKTTEDIEFKAGYVVLALGRRGTPRKLGVPGEDLPKVLYQLIDAQSYQKQHVLVVGGGDSAVEAAVGLARQLGNKVTISYRKSRFFRIKKKNEVAIQHMISSKSIDAVFESQVKEIRESTVVLTSPVGEIELPNDAVIIQAFPRLKCSKNSVSLLAANP